MAARTRLELYHFHCCESKALPLPPDVISIDKTGEHFRLIYDVKGRFTVHRITAEEAKVRPPVQPLLSRVRSSHQQKLAISVKWRFYCSLFLLQYKLCKVKKIIIGTKGIPHLVTHDARTIRYPDPLIKVNDTVRIDLDTGKITDFIKFDTGRFLTPPPAVFWMCC